MNELTSGLVYIINGLDEFSINLALIKAEKVSDTYDILIINAEFCALE
jgi:hypothetical protein